MSVPRLRRRLLGLDRREVDALLAARASHLAELEQEHARLQEDLERLAVEPVADEGSLHAALEIARRVAAELVSKSAAEREQAVESARAAAAGLAAEADRELDARERELAKAHAQLAARRAALERTLRDVLAHLEEAPPGEPLAGALESAVQALTRRLGIAPGGGAA